MEGPHMSRFAKALVLFVLLACASGAGALAGEEPSAEQTRQDRQPPAARVPTLVVGEEPLVVREVRCYEVLPGATESRGQAAPEEPGQGQQPTPEDEAEQETPGQ